MKQKKKIYKSPVMDVTHFDIDMAVMAGVYPDETWDGDIIEIGSSEPDGGPTTPVFDIDW